MYNFPIKKIESALTLNGQIPLECSFLVDGLIHVWNPSTHFQTLVLRPGNFAQACRRYLEERNQVYDSLDQVVQVGIREKWPNWEKMTKPLYDDDDC